MKKRQVSLVLVAVMIFSLIVSANAFITASAATTVSDSAFENISMNVGSDETERNFIWHSKSEEGFLDYAVRNGDSFPSEYASVATTVSNFNGIYVHRATAYDLAYETEYVYRFRSGNNVSKNRYFETDAAAHFNFIYVGDPQIGSNGVTNDTAKWKNTITTAVTRFPETSLIVSAGDQVDSEFAIEQFQGFIAPKEFDSLAVATTIGNHDYDSHYYKNFFNTPNTVIDGKTYGNSEAGSDYWFTYNNVLFINLNTCNIEWDEHKEFMQKAIDANPNATWKVVVTHYSFFGAGPYYINEEIAKRRAIFGPMVDELGIDMVLSGHEHVYARSYMINDGTTPDNANGPQSSVTDPEGVLYLTGGSSSGSKYYTLLDDSQTPHIAVKAKDTTAYSNVEVDGDSFKITTYRLSDGSVLDSFEIIKDKEPHEDLANKDVAEGRGYTASGVSSTLPDSNGKSLTDGKTTFVGFDKFSGGTADITVDLGASYNVDHFTAYVDAATVKSVAIYTSKNNSDFTYAGITNVKQSSSTSCQPVSLTLDKAIDARYVRFCITPRSNSALVAELDVFKKHTHVNSDWSIVNDATYHSAGVRVKRCTECGMAYEHEVIPMKTLSEDETNVALGKKYTNSPVYKKDDTYEKYPDETGVSMTDGVYAPDGAIYSAEEYVGFNTADSFYNENGYFLVTVDLGREYHLNRLVAYTASKAATAGVVGPKNVSFYVSTDNKSWISAGSVSPTDTDKESMVAAELNLENAVYARYVQYRFKPTSNFVMVAELEAHKTEVKAHEHVSSAWIEARPATLHEEGLRIKTCTLCGIHTEEETIPKIDPGKYGENLVLGKSYERSDLYQRDAGVDRYPDENGTSMTDGKIAPETALYSNEAYMGFYARNNDYLEAGYFHITFDLGAAYDLRRFTTYVASQYNGSAGVEAPKTVQIYVSNDGTSWSLVETKTPEDTDTVSCIAIDFVLEKAVTARYVQFRYVHKNTFVMVAEVEVYGVPAVQNDVSLGDVNADGAIDQFDYILVKRHYFETRLLTDDELPRADVNGDGAIDQFDYILIKRHYFGTYIIGG